MRFGKVPLAAADGGILAHSIRGDRMVFRKGTVLGSAEIGALIDAGIAEVTVASLEPGDIAEDVAAHRVAAAVKASGVSESGKNG